MSGIGQRAVTARSALWCDKCGARWESPIYVVGNRFQQEAEEAQVAFNIGWRVFVGKRTQHTYCPRCEPTVPMRQVNPEIGGQR